MMLGKDVINMGAAIADFRRARNQADLQEMLARLKGESTQLLSYDDVRKKLKLQSISERGLREIPLEHIVGSVGRYTDFTRDFLPRREIDANRWARVNIATSGLVGLPPIDVFQIGDVYFVEDGNHRVSVARTSGATHIQAYVTEVQTRVVPTPDTTPDDLILMAEYATFLEKTQLDKLRPDARLKVTAPGKYDDLLEHINVHRYYMGLDLKRDITYEEAAAHWYDLVYLPVVEIIHAQGILREFPGRTETDLYLWLAEHRAYLEEQLGWKIENQSAVSNLVEQHSPTTARMLSRLGTKILDKITPDSLEGGPPPGAWRTQTEARPTDRLFLEILTAIDGKEGGWCALEQAIIVARREGAVLNGMHVLPARQAQTSPENQHIKQEYDRRIKEAGLVGSLAFATGEISRQICDRAVWNDLVVVNLNYPPDSRPIARMGSGFRNLILRSPRPILAIPRSVSSLEQALLAFDGSPKAYEALYVATYLAGKWGMPLFVVSVKSSGRVSENTLRKAQDYLENHGVRASYIAKSGPVANALLQTMDENNCDLLIMGGYGLNPIFEIMLGSAVDQVLRQSCQAMLICR